VRDPSFASNSVQHLPDLLPVIGLRRLPPLFVLLYIEYTDKFTIAYSCYCLDTLHTDTDCLFGTRR
jgi:hypothetical protein